MIYAGCSENILQLIAWAKEYPGFLVPGKRYQIYPSYPEGQRHPAYILVAEGTHAQTPDPWGGKFFQNNNFPPRCSFCQRPTTRRAAFTAHPVRNQDASYHPNWAFGTYDDRIIRQDTYRRGRIEGTPQAVLHRLTEGTAPQIFAFNRTVERNPR